MGKPTETIAAGDNRTIDRRLQQAVGLLQRGAFADAERQLTGLLAEQPDNPDAHRTMALLASRTGRQSLALRHMAEACRLAPEHAELHFQLACLQAHLGQLEPALQHFHRVTQRLPDFVDGWLLLGTTLVGLQRDAEALAPLRHAHRLAPDNIKALQALADAEFRSGWPTDALPLWRTLLQQRPDDVHVRLRTAETLCQLGDQDEAVALYREGVARQPAADALWLALGQAEEDNGGRDAARVAYERALALRPGWPFALACLLGMLRGQAPAALRQQARSALDGASGGALIKQALADDDRALVGYALGKVHDGRGEYAPAMACWHDANAARRRVAGEPAPDALRRRVDRLIDGFRSELFSDNVASLPAAGERLLFVVGMPRSGTTLTEQILASHPQASGCGELPDMTLIARGLSVDGTQARPEPRALLQPGALRAAIDRYTTAVTRHAADDALRLVDKEPLNFFHLGLVALMFPQARVIWCRRDPRDIAVSIYGENFALAETLATDLAGIGHYIAQHERLMRHWQSVLPLPILESGYEQLVADPANQVRRIVEFSGLPWDPACLDFHRSERAVQSPSRWQVRQPLHARSVGRWRHYAADLTPLLQVLDDPDRAPASPSSLSSATKATADPSLRSG